MQVLCQIFFKMLLINENVFVFVYIVEHRRELIKNPIGQKYFKLMSKRKEGEKSV